MLICGFRRLVGQYQRWLVEVADGSRRGSPLSLWLQGIWRLDCGFWTKGFWLASKSGFFFFGDIFWLFLAVMLQQIKICSDTKNDAGQPEQN